MKSTVSLIERNKSLNMKIKDRYCRDKLNRREQARSEIRGQRKGKVAHSHRRNRSDIVSDLASSVQ